MPGDAELELKYAYLEAMGVVAWERRSLPAGEDAGRPRPTDGVPAAGSPVQADPQRESPQHGVAGAPGWDALKDAVAACECCPELAAHRTQTVFGVGNRRAKLMVVGEAPGADEDRLGEPFVGRAGKLLDAMLAAIGHTRDTVYIANILKCRPPNNRDPLPDEAAACEAYLRRQISLIQPRALLAVGRIAAQNLLKSQQPIGKLRGTVHRLDGELPVVVTYHPAYLLRTPSDKQKAWTDLRRVRQVSKEEQ